MINPELLPSEPDLSQLLDCFSVYGDNCPTYRKVGKSMISNGNQGKIEEIKPWLFGTGNCSKNSEKCRSK